MPNGELVWAVKSVPDGKGGPLLGVVGVGRFNDDEDLADAVLEPLAGFLFSLEFFFRLLF